MKTANLSRQNFNGSYSKSARELLYGKLKGTRYTSEVAKILSHWGLNFSQEYIRGVATGHYYNERIWDAIAEHLDNRQRKQATIDSRIKHLLS